MREANGATVDARTAGTVERLEDQGWQGVRWSWQAGRVQPAAGWLRKEPELGGSPQKEHVRRRRKRQKRIGEWRRGGRHWGGGVAVGVEGVITTAFRQWTETVSVREPRRRVKKWGERERT